MRRGDAEEPELVLRSAAVRGACGLVRRASANRLADVSSGHCFRELVRVYYQFEWKITSVSMHHATS